jgi:hypothetical protein
LAEANERRPAALYQAIFATKPCHDLLYISGDFRRLYPVGTVWCLPWSMGPQSLGKGQL